MKKHLALSRTSTFTGFLLIVSGLSSTLSEAAIRRVRFVAIAESRFTLPKAALNPPLMPPVRDANRKALDFPDTTLTCQVHLRNVSGTDQEISILDLRYFSAPTPNNGANKQNEQGMCIRTRSGSGDCDTNGVRSTLLNQTFIYRLNSRTNGQNTISPISDFPVTLNRYSMNGDAALIQWRRRVPIIPNYDNNSQVAEQQHVTHYCTGTIEVRDVTTQSITKPGAVIASGALEFVAGSEIAAPRQTTQIIHPNHIPPPRSSGDRLHDGMLVLNLLPNELPSNFAQQNRPRSLPNDTQDHNGRTLIRTINHYNPGRIIFFNSDALRSGVEYYLFEHPDQQRYLDPRYNIAVRPPGFAGPNPPIYRLSTDLNYLNLLGQLNTSEFAFAAETYPYPPLPPVTALGAPACRSNPCAEEIFTTGGAAPSTNMAHTFQNTIDPTITYRRIPDTQLDPFFNFTTTPTTTGSPSGPTNAPNIPGVYYNFPQHIHSMPIVINGGKPF